ncbi:hypothetical protein IEQ34_007128 [Dendrobium chrysotoxum]|uniref:Uncharacterized protein n=1 Tax=Dendrobium chrysotoxum TaxID=161865 RepID=A0AAV7H903_DENCH|nr:hypothetical protein IEQ34_007128 [Dendrobium chrysotoxum]
MKNKSWNTSFGGNIICPWQEHVAVLTPTGEAELNRGKRDNVEKNRVIDAGVNDGSISRSSEDGYADATGGEDFGHVDHRKHVAWCHEREEKHVEMTGFRDHCRIMAREQHSVVYS